MISRIISILLLITCTNAFFDLDFYNFLPSQTTDVLVIGSGAAGLAAANSALLRGAKVLMIEKHSSFYKSTTQRSGGVFWIPNNPFANLSRTDTLKYMARLASANYNPHDQYLGLGSRSYKMLETYYDEGRNMLNEFNASLVFSYTKSLSPSINNYPLLSNGPFYRNGCLQCYNFNLTHPTASSALSGASEALIKWMSEALLRNPNFTVKFNTSAEDIIYTKSSIFGFRVGGIVAKNMNTGNTFRIKAKKGVIFATGGFSRNSEYLERFIGGPLYTQGCANPNAQGDFLRMALEIGGINVENLQEGWLLETSLEKYIQYNALGFENLGINGNFFQLYFLTGDAMMVVNKAGKRVYNEKATYNERAKVHFNIATDPDGPNYTNRVLISIYDNFTHHTQTFNTPPYGGAEMIRGENRTHLAQMIRARLETLKNFTGQFQLGDDFEENLNQTWDRYNQFAITGVDKDFGRGKSPTDVEWDAYLYQVICNQLGQPCNYTNPRPNPTMRELHYEGPYYAMIITAGLQDTKGGPMINENSQVMDMWGDPINGLYGAGNAVGVAVKIAYPAPGATIGNALIFGYKAGKHAAAQPNFP